MDSDVLAGIVFPCWHIVFSQVTFSLFPFSELVVMTGTSSGLGRKAALALLRTGDYHVIGAVRDLDKMEAVAEVDGFGATLKLTSLAVKISLVLTLQTLPKFIAAYRRGAEYPTIVSQ